MRAIPSYRSSLCSIFRLFLILCPNFLLAEGFIAGTLVSTPNGFRAIETLRAGDAVISRTLLGKPTIGKITKITRVQRKNFVELVIQGQQYFVDNDQKFYLEGRYRSCQAYALSPGDTLIGIHGQNGRIENIYFWHEETPIEMYALSVARYHNFCIGTSEFITHNMDFVLETRQAALIFAAGGGLALSSPAILAIEGGCLLAFGISLLTEHIRENKNRAFLKQKSSNKRSSESKKNNNEKKNGPSRPPQDPKKDDNNHSNGIYNGVSYHHKNSTGRKNPAPKNGQKALDNSVQIKNTSPRRIGISDGEIVILDQTSEGIFHGHVRTWQELSRDANMRSAQNVLLENNFVDKFGTIL